MINPAARRTDSDSSMADQIDEATEEPTRPMRGFESLAEAVRSEPDDEFPMDRSGIDYGFGDIEVEDGKGGYLPVRDLTDTLPRDSYDDAESVLKALREALDRRR